MNRVKIKKIKVPLANDEDMATMFNQMLGTGSVNLSIAYPRYLRIKIILEQLIKLFEILTASPFFRNNIEFAVERVEIERFCLTQRELIAKYFVVDLSEYEWNWDTVDEVLQKRFTEIYEEMKKSDLINTFIIICDRLVKYKEYFTNLDNLNHKFVNVMPGTEWNPFPFTNLNIKYIFSLQEAENSIVFFMTFLSKVFKMSYGLYQEIQSPDIDVDKFVEVIMANIDEIQKRPELNRCRKAFAKIKESVHLLKTNFTGYYRDFVGTQDSTIMMQHFILDVSKNTNADAQTTNQFRQIIAYYRKIAAEQVSNPKAKVLLEKLNSSLQQMERGTENLVKIDESQDSEYVDDTDPIQFGPSAISLHDLGDMLGEVTKELEEEGVDSDREIHAIDLSKLTIDDIKSGNYEPGKTTIMSGGRSTGEIPNTLKRPNTTPTIDHMTHAILYHQSHCPECNTAIRRCKDGFICQSNHKFTAAHSKFAAIEKQMNSITGLKMRLKSKGFSIIPEDCPECEEKEVSFCSCFMLRSCSNGHMWMPHCRMCRGVCKNQNHWPDI